MESVVLRDQNGERLDAQAVAFVHAGECADKFRERMKTEHPDWKFGDEESEQEEELEQA